MFSDISPAFAGQRPSASPSTAGVVVILGAGALGAYVGGMLERAGHEVVLVDKWKDHVEAIRTRGLTINDVDGECVVRLQALHLDEAAALTGLEPRFVLLTAKLFETREYLEKVSPYLSQSYPLVTMQNSMIDDEVAAFAGEGRVLGAIATGINVGLEGPGCVARGSRRFEKTVFQVGELTAGDSDRARGIAAVLAHVDGAQVTPALRRKRWEKLGVNSLTSGVSAISGLSTSEVLRSDATRELLLRLGTEFIAVARQCGHDLPALMGASSGDWHAAAAGNERARESVGRAFQAAAARIIPGFESGMLRDMRNGRATEVDYFSGLVFKYSQQANVLAHGHGMVAAFVKKMEAARLEPGRQHLDDLLRSLKTQPML